MRTLLDQADEVFMLRMQIIEGGSGFFMGILDEPNQAAPAAYVFNSPRRMLRVDRVSPVRPSMVIKTPDGAVFMVARHGMSEQGSAFRSFRLFEATEQLLWQRRGSTIDPVTHMPTEAPMVDMGLIYVSYEPDQREAYDRQLKASIETAKFITAAPVQRDDILGGNKIIRADHLLGLTIGNLN